MCKEMTVCGLTMSSVLEMKSRLLFVLTTCGQMGAVRTLEWFAMDRKVTIDNNNKVLPLGESHKNDCHKSLVYNFCSSLAGLGLG